MVQEKEKNLYGNQETIQNQETIPMKGGEERIPEKIQSISETPLLSSYLSAEGNVRFKMTNDYLFRAVFQSNEKALKGLLCSMLHLKPKEIRTIEITNPIELGKSLDDKTFILDITLKLNDRSIINIEMQVSNWLNWPERSLSYLCRTFDHLMRGEDYLEAWPVTQICFLDFTLFPQFPEFYATYQMLNTKNHNLYSDKFTLSVVDLTQVMAATEEDKANGIDQWAALFKATNWEEIKMLSQKNEYLEEASQSMYQLSADERIRQQCEAREENERLERAMRKMKEKLGKESIVIEEQKAEIQEQKAEIQEQKAEIQEQKAEIQEQKEEIQEQKAEIQEQKAEIQEQKAEIQEQQAEIQEQKAEIQEQKAEIQEQKEEIQEQKEEIQEQKAEIQEQKAEIQEQQAELEKQRDKLKEWEARLREREAQLKNKN